MAVAQHDFARIGTLTVSAGVTQHKDDDDDQSLLVRVDNALYLSKLNGRNRVSVVT
jgi:PleD family two-component response regulator